MESTPSADAPIDCTLGTGEFRERIDWIAELNRTALLDARREGSRLILTYRPDHTGRVREMVHRERQCCAFLGFDLKEEEDRVTLVIEAPGGAGDALDAIFEPFLAAKADRCPASSDERGEDNG